jgi:hypothetical protein
VHIIKICESWVWWLKTVILAIWEVEIQRIAVQGQPWARSSQDPISTNGKVWWHMPIIPATQGSKNRKIVVQVVPRIK